MEAALWGTLSLLACLAPKQSGTDMAGMTLPAVEVVAPANPASRKTYEGDKVRSLPSGAVPRTVAWSDLMKQYPHAPKSLGFPEEGTLTVAQDRTVSRPLLFAIDMSNSAEVRSRARQVYGAFLSQVHPDQSHPATAQSTCRFESIDEKALSNLIDVAIADLGNAEQTAVIQSLSLCSDLYEANWDPKSGSQRHGVLTSPGVVPIGGRSYYVGMTLIWADLQTIRNVEKDTNAQLSDVGQDYTAVWPVADRYFVGPGEGPRSGSLFRSLETYFQSITEEDVDDIAYCSVLIEGFERGYPVSDYFLNPRDFVDLYDLDSMHGRDILLPFGPVEAGRQVGYLVVSFVEWNYSIWGHSDTKEEHIDSLIASLGNWKRRAEWIHSASKN